MVLGRVGEVALGATTLITGGLLLAGCGKDEEPQTSPGDDTEFDRGPAPDTGPGRQVAPRPPARPRPQAKAATVAHAQFDPFDRNDTGGITRGEVRRAVRGRGIDGRRQWSDGAHGARHWKQRVGHQRVTLSIADAFTAANRLGARDNRATWLELTRLAATFDTDGIAGLSAREKAAFVRRYGPDVVQRENVWTGWDRGTVRPPRTSPGDDRQPPRTSPGDDPWRDPYPDNGGGHTSPGDDHGHTSPGDEPPRGGGHTSPGDDHGGGGGGTSPGDDRPTRPSPPPYDPPPYDPPPRPSEPSPGDSTDNGNPGEDDF